MDKTKLEAIVKVESATVALSSLPDETVITETISKAETAVRATGECLAYLREAKVRFDNRGRAGREICGYVGWKDFVERGLGKSIRTVQRQILESVEPERAEERREKARLASQEETFVSRLERPGGFAEKCKDRVLRALVFEQARLLDSGIWEDMFEAAVMEGRIVGHIWEEADRKAAEKHRPNCPCHFCDPEGIERYGSDRAVGTNDGEWE